MTSTVRCQPGNTFQPCVAEVRKEGRRTMIGLLVSREERAKGSGVDTVYINATTQVFRLSEGVALIVSLCSPWGQGRGRFNLVRFKVEKSENCTLYKA